MSVRQEKLAFALCVGPSAPRYLCWRSVALPQRHPVTIPPVENVDVFLAGSKKFPRVGLLGRTEQRSYSGQGLRRKHGGHFPDNVRFQVVACSDVCRALLAQIVPYCAIWRPTSVCLQVSMRQLHPAAEAVPAWKAWPFSSQFSRGRF